ncbi:S9 family peptidase [Saliphagus sp. LR7]|uniref:S9 family peptidase n=1 Tax=Saliphagus sp. LR7 TaxID=2282654 RepID=UPI000DF82D40|nr:S9 family peptidase [Saliphagus sp. LR7]
MDRIEASHYRDLAGAEEPRLSPDDERVAFVRTEPEDDETVGATVHLAELAGDGARQFTASDGSDSQPRWRPDGTHLAFSSTRGEGERPQLWLLPTDGGEARQLTRVVGGVSDLEWSPDSTRLAFTQRVTAEDREEGRDLEADPDYEREPPDPRVIDRTVYRAHREYADGRRRHVYVVDVEAALDDDRKEAITRITDGDRDYAAPTWGDSGTLYYASKHRDADDPDDSIRHEIYDHDLGGEPSALTETTGWEVSLEATTDGRVAYTYTPEERATMRQTELRVHHPDGEETTPTEAVDRTLAVGFEWGPEEDRLYFGTPDEGSVVLRSVPGDASAKPRTVVDGTTLESFSVGTNAVATVESEWDHPGDVFVSTPGGAERRRLTRINREYLDGRAVSEPEEVWVEGEAGPIQGWVLTPPDFDPDREYPLVVEIHGGPHAQWTTGGSTWHEFQTLAARGYVVFWSNPRGSTGYGEDHAMAIDRDWGAITFADVIAGTEEIASREYVDEDEQYVTGGSFGGFMTAWAVGHTDRFRAAVAQRGVYDLTGFYGSTDAFKLVEGDFDTTPWEDPELLWTQSPVANADDVETPTLLLHSDRDYRTPANTAELFYLGLKKSGTDTRLVRYPREGHELSRSGEPGHVVDRIERIARWFDGYSERREVPPALERDPEAGLSGVGETGSDDEDGENETDE